MSGGDRRGGRLPVGRAAAAVALAAAVAGGGVSAWLEVARRSDASPPPRAAASTAGEQRGDGSSAAGSRHAKPRSARPEQEPGTQRQPGRDTRQGRDTQPGRDPRSEPRRAAGRAAASLGGLPTWLGSGLGGLPAALAYVEGLPERGHEAEPAAPPSGKDTLTSVRAQGEKTAVAEDTAADTESRSEPATTRREPPRSEPAPKPEPKRECRLPSNADPDRPGIQQAEVDELGPEWVSDDTKRDVARAMLC